MIALRLAGRSGTVINWFVCWFWSWIHCHEQ